MDNKVKFGLCNVYYALLTFDSAGKPSFATPVKIPGGVNLTLSPEGDITPFYADNITYWLAGMNAGYSGDLETALLPDAFKKDVLNYVADKNGALVETTNAEYNPFALLFQIEGDKHARRHVLYNCGANRPQITAATTTASKEPNTDTVPITCSSIPNESLGEDIVKASVKKGDTGYDNFFKNVYLPEKATAATNNG